MSHLWVVKGTGGYFVTEYDGTCLFYAGMACNAKGYTMGKEYKLINDKSNIQLLKEYTDATGKRYWKSTESGYF